MSKTHLTQRYHFNTVCAGILRLINRPAEYTRLHQFLDEEFFFKDDQNPEVTVLRETIKTAKLVFEENGGNVNSLKMPMLLDRFLSYNTDQDKGRAYRGQVQTWLTNGEIKSKMEDDSTFDGIVSYIKAIQFAKHSQDLYKNYQTGKISEAIKVMEKILSTVNRIGESLSDNIDLTPKGIWDYLETNANRNHSPLTDRLFMGENTEIDKCLGGFERQTLNIFIAPTGNGKTVMCHHIVRRAVQQRMKVHLFCVEDRYKSFIYKYLAAQTGIEISRIKTMQWHNESERTMVQRAIQDLKSYVHVQFVYGHSVETIHQLSMEYDTDQRSKGFEPPVIHIIDYTGHIASQSKGDKTHEKMRSAYAARKDFALKQNKMCFDFAQINRSGNQRAREENVVTHADLAGAYDLAQVCDNILSISRSPTDITNQTAVINVCKARDGELGKFIVKTEFAKGRFNLEKETDIVDNGFAMPSNVTPLKPY